MSATTGSGTRAGDAWGGLASMLVAFPSAIAYGVMVYAVLGEDARGAVFGVVGAVVLGTVVPLVGGAPRLVSAPCGPAAVLLAALARDLLAGGGGTHPPVPPESVAVLVAVVSLLSAGLQFLYGAAGGGRLIKYIPYPVVAGYLSGVGLLILAAQVPKLLGLPRGADPWKGILAPGSWALPALATGTATVLGMVLAPRITRRVPAVILGLAAGLLTYLLLGLLDPALRTLEGNRFVIGPLRAGGPGEVVASAIDLWTAAGEMDLRSLSLVLVPAFTLSVLLSVDTLKTCVVVDALTRSRHDSNRVLRGQGVGNFLSAVLGGMPGAGTMGATLVNTNSGGTTRVSGLFEGLFSLAAFLVLGGLIAWIPVGALAGILAVVSFRMIDRHSIDLLRNPSTRLDFAVVAAVVVAALATNLIVASGVGLALSILLFIREQIQVSVLHRRTRGDSISSKRDRSPEERALLRERGAATVVCEVQGTLFFGTTDQLFSLIEEDLKTCRDLVLDLRRVQSLDYTAARMLGQIEAILTDRGAWLHYTHLPASLPSGRDLRAYLDQVGLAAADRNVRVYDGMHEALEWIEDRILEEAGIPSASSGPPLALEEFALFREFGEGSRKFLEEAVESRTVAAGEAVFRRGEEGSELFLIRRGTVHIRLPLEGGRHKHLATFSRGGFFGDMAFLDQRRRSADAVAVEETDLFLLRRGRFDELSHEHPRRGAMLFARMAKILAERLRRTDTELRVREES